MADIAGINTIPSLEPTRKPTDVEDRLANVEEETVRAEEVAAQETAAFETGEAQAANRPSATNDIGVTEEAGADQPATAQGGREIFDQISLSPEAQQIIRQQEITANEFAPANDTNQDERDEDRTGVVNGNRNEEPRQARALGKIVDQFA